MFDQSYIKFTYQDYQNYRYKYYITKLSLKHIPILNNNSDSNNNSSSNNNNNINNNSSSNNYKISPNVTHLILSNFNDELEENLEYIIHPTTNHLILDKYNKSLIVKSPFDSSSSNSIIPSFITSLRLQSFDRPIEKALPNSIRSLVFSKFNQPLEIGDLPDSLTSLEFISFNQELKINSLPSGITSLKLGFSYNSILVPNVLPKSLKHLVLSFSYNHPINDGVLPYGLETLETGSMFNSLIGKYALPSTLLYLKFGDSYNQLCSDLYLPSNLKTIIFSSNFNQSSIPPNWLSNMCKEIDTITFGFRFNGSILINSIPSTVSRVSFGSSFNQVLKKSLLPIGLKSMALFYHFNSVIEELPSSLESLSIYGLFKLDLFSNHTLPNSITFLDLYHLSEYPHEVVSLPSSITHLAGCFNKPISNQAFENTKHLRKVKLKNYQHTLTLPNSVVHFTFDGLFDCDKFNLDQLTNLTTLKIKIFYSKVDKNKQHLNHIRPNYLPSSITKLHLPLINHDITQDIIPQQVKTLFIQYPLSKYRIEEFAIPNGVSKLTISYSRESIPIQNNKCYQLKKDMVPISVTNLKFVNFNQPLQSPSILPSSITSLSLGDEFKNQIGKHNTPKSLLKCKVGLISKELISKDLLQDVVVIRKYYE